MLEEYGISNSSYELINNSDSLAVIQRDEAIAAISRFNVKKSFPISLNKYGLMALLCSCIIFIVFALLPAKAKEDAKRIHEIKEAKKQIEEALEEAIEDIEELSKEEQLQAEELKKTYLAQIPAGRFGQPDDIANACVFLASDEASYINGQTLHVNGGMGRF